MCANERKVKVCVRARVYSYWGRSFGEGRGWGKVRNDDFSMWSNVHNHERMAEAERHQTEGESSQEDRGIRLLAETSHSLRTEKTNCVKTGRFAANKHVNKFMIRQMTF